MVSPESSSALDSLQAIQGSGRSADGLVSVTVQGGQPIDLHIKPAAMDLTSTELADRVLAAMRQAHEDSTAQMAQYVDSHPIAPGTQSGRAVEAQVREEMDRMSEQVSSQLDDINRRLNRLMGNAS